MPVNLISPEGKAVVVPDDQAAVYLRPGSGFRQEGSQERAQRVGAEAQEANTSALDAGLRSAFSTASGGLTDIAERAVGGEDARIRAQQTEESHGKASFVGGVAGAFMPGGAVGRVAKAVEGVGGAGIIGGAVRGVIEGGAMGAQQGVHDLALSGDPLTAERITGALTSNMLLGGAIGGIAGGAGKALETGLGRAKAALDEHIAATSASSAIPEDLTGLDAKGLRAARDAETQSLEAARVPMRKEFVDDLGAYRTELKDSKAYIAAKAAEDTEVPALVAKADERVRNLLNNKAVIEKNPGRALEALQQQAQAYQSILDNAESIKANVARQAAEETDAAVAGAKIEPGDTASARLDALAKVPDALEKNRALQARISELTAPHSSPRLTAIQDATDVIANGGRKPSVAERMLGGAAYGIAAGAAAHVPFVGPLLAPLAGAKVSEAVTNLMFGRVANVASDAAKRTSSAIGKFLDVAAKAPPVAPVLATKVLSAVRYAPETHEERRARIVNEVGGAKAEEPVLADAFKKRAAELRSQVAIDETGAVRMKPDARQALADRISPIRAHAPLLADQIETTAARKVEFLNSKLPKRPDIGMTIGPDKYQPSDMEMRQFARYAAAAEDPGAVEERLAHGSITPEDIEAYHAIYPERAAHLQQQLISRLSDLQATLPYQRRLSLSMFSGVPVDPAMHPQILAVLQGSFSLDNAASDDGPPGMQAPKAMPQFGSVARPEPTPAQERASR